MSNQMELRHLARDTKTALELAIAALAPSDLVDRLAVSAGLLDAITRHDPRRDASARRAHREAGHLGARGLARVARDARDDRNRVAAVSVRLAHECRRSGILHCTRAPTLGPFGCSGGVPRRLATLGGPSPAGPDREMRMCMIHGIKWGLAPLCAVQLLACVVGDDPSDAPDDSSYDDLPADAPDVESTAATLGTTYTFSGGDFKAALEKLRPGDTLKIRAGTYDLRTPTSAGIAPNLTPGTAAAPILVTAENPYDWPHFRGQLVLNHPSFYTFKRLRVEGVRPASGAVPSSTVTVAGGNHWTLVNMEIWGAAATGSFANLSISTERTPTARWDPNGWRVIYSCIHDAGPGTAPGHDSVTDHNIYVNSEGTGPDGGLIARNIFYGAYNGSQIKVGAGGVADAPSGDNIAIEYNTMHHATRHVVLFGHHTRAISLKGNLMKSAEGRVPDLAYRDGISLQQLAGVRSVTAHDNYVHDADLAVGRHALASGAYVPPSPDTNRLFKTVATEPRFNSSGCGDGSPGAGPRDYVPGNATAARYGRYAPGGY